MDRRSRRGPGSSRDLAACRAAGVTPELMRYESLKTRMKWRPPRRRRFSAELPVQRI